MNHDIRLQIEGSLLEKLIDRALENGAVFAHIHRPSSRCMIIDADLRSAEKLFSLCRRYGYSCRQLRRSGKTAMLDCLRRRWTVIPGLLLGAVMCMLFLGRVWLVDIQFTGESAHLGNRAEILSCLQENDIHPGISRSAVDTAILQKQVLAGVPSCSHAGIRLQGIRLLAEVSPEAPAPDLYEIEYARDLVSLRSGVIEEIDVYSGQACVKPGDTVLQGDTLIRGEENVGKNTETGEFITSPVGALGKVSARCWFEGSAQAQIASTQQIRTGNTRTSSRLSLMNLSLPLLQCDHFSAEETETEILPIAGLFIPLQMERSTHYETVSRLIQPDRAHLQKQLEQLARSDALRQISTGVKEYEILSSWIDAAEKGNTLHVRAVYEISTDIAAQRDALIEEVY